MARDNLDDLEEAWVGPERDTAKQIKRIESSAPPVSYPGGRHWTPAGVMLVLGGVSALSVTLGGVLGPLLMKPDLSGYVKAERLTSCEAKLDTRAEAHEKALEVERGRTSECYDRLGACQSQSGAQKALVESLGTKRRR